jgi:hypothetical protein
MNHTDPLFVLSSEERSSVNPLPEPIRAGEWSDLTFFARPIHEPGREWLTGFERALNRVDVPVELRSKSKYRLAWTDIEFLREEVVSEWPHWGCGAVHETGHQKALHSLSNEVAGGTVGPGRSTKKIAPLADRQLRTWYEQRVRELTTRGETSSGEQDWEAAKQEFQGRITRARVRALREELAPEHWRQQGRRSAWKES